MVNTESGLEGAVRELTKATQELHRELRDNYPQRGEIEREYVTKFSQQTVVIRILVIGMIAVAICFAGTIGSYAVCLVGDDNPGICRAVPGYEERIERRSQINETNLRQDREIRRLKKMSQRSG